MKKKRKQLQTKFSKQIKFLRDYLQEKKIVNSVEKYLKSLERQAQDTGIQKVDGIYKLVQEHHLGYELSSLNIGEPYSINPFEDRRSRIDFRINPDRSITVITTFASADYLDSYEHIHEAHENAKEEFNNMPNAKILQVVNDSQNSCLSSWITYSSANIGQMRFYPNDGLYMVLEIKLTSNLQTVEDLVEAIKLIFEVTAEKSCRIFN